MIPCKLEQKCYVTKRIPDYGPRKKEQKVKQSKWCRMFACLPSRVWLYRQEIAWQARKTSLEADGLRSLPSRCQTQKIRDKTSSQLTAEGSR